MFPVDALPVAYLEERDAEIKAARRAELEEAARAFKQQSLAEKEPPSVYSTPLSSPTPTAGFISTFFSAFTRNLDTPSMPVSRVASVIPSGAVTPRSPSLEATKSPTLEAVKAANASNMNKSR